MLFKQPPLSRAEVVEGQISDAHADESFDPVTDGLNHITDLAFQSGIEDHLHASGGNSFDRNGAALADFGEDAFFKLAENGILKGIFGGDVVDLLDAVAGMGQRLGQFAIVAENEEALGILVEPADVGQMLESSRKKLVNGGAIVFVLSRADQSSGFVKDDGLKHQGFDAFSGGSDLIAGLNAVGRREAGLSIDQNFSLLDEGVARPSGSDSG